MIHVVLSAVAIVVSSGTVVFSDRAESAIFTSYFSDSSRFEEVAIAQNTTSKTDPNEENDDPIVDPN
ncbi:hypothetical protein JJD41_10090 [Oxynema sp. CENA135]|uniref:hypothetical protein n=1 Tax=Oxynema sp. CENA135 TaxID=984206 RepID=UPI00190DDCFC|nr:hypothetical protein [Oxynema sp. CENA135]MBK4730207.1 hypothetical protein [Oxynema sp. CENA135]